MFEIELYDLERVEVPRRQGTVYGKNTTCGATNFIIHKPGFDNPRRRAGRRRDLERNIAIKLYLTNAVGMQGFEFYYRYMGTSRMFGVDASIIFRRRPA